MWTELLLEWMSGYRIYLLVALLITWQSTKRGQQTPHLSWLVLNGNRDCHMIQNQLEITLEYSTREQQVLISNHSQITYVSIPNDVRCRASIDLKLKVERMCALGLVVGHRWEGVFLANSWPCQKHSHNTYCVHFQPNIETVSLSQTLYGIMIS